MATRGNFHQLWARHICCIPGITINLIVAFKSWHLFVCKKTPSISDNAFWHWFCFFQTVSTSTYDGKDTIFSCLLLLPLLQTRRHFWSQKIKCYMLGWCPSLISKVKQCSWNKQRRCQFTVKRKADLLILLQRCLLSKHLLFHVQ